LAKVLSVIGIRTGIGTQKIGMLETRQKVLVIGVIIHLFSIPTWIDLNGRNTYGLSVTWNISDRRLGF